MRVRARLVELDQFWKSPKQGTPGVQIMFEVMGGQADAGQRVRFTGWLSEKAFMLGKRETTPRAETLRVLEACGWDRKKVKLSQLTPKHLQKAVEMVMGTEIGEDGVARVGPRFVNALKTLQRSADVDAGDRDWLDEIGAEGIDVDVEPEPAADRRVDDFGPGLG
jgi:hypothetical protein